MEKKNRQNWKQHVLLAVTVLLIAVLLQLLYARRQGGFPELRPENGVLDLRETDVSDQVYRVANCWDYYPFRLYGPEDFSSGVPEAPVRAGRDISTDAVPYGTYRLKVLAEPGAVYAICGFALDYSTRVIVNGTELMRFGMPADSPEASVPGGGYMTIPLAIGETGQLELLYQYSNFVHKEGGFIPATYLSTPQKIQQYQSGNVLVSVGLSGAMLIFSMYFLLIAVVQRQPGYLCLTLCTLLMALRDNLFLDSFLLPPEVSWYVVYRTSLTVTALLPAAFLLLLRSLYPVGVSWIHRLYLGFLGADVFLLLVLDTRNCVLFSQVAYLLSLPYFGYLVWGIVCHFRRQRKVDQADWLTLGGLGVLLASLFLEAILARHNAAATRFGFAPGGMLICMLLIAIAIGLRVQAQKAALAESHSRSVLLEQMNAMNLDFLQKVAHELKTPLTVISGYAQLAGMQLSANQLSQETPENLRTIHREAMRLADLVTKLMDYSYGNQSGVTFGRVNVEALLDGVRAICTPMGLKNNNRVEIQRRDCADVYGNHEMLLQIFINLVMNANRHTENGTITISASDQESTEYVVFRVSDTGSGIPETLRPHIFEKGCSGVGSSGLGLAICQDVVEAHGGQIRLERTDSSGTVFAFTVLRKEISQ